MLSGDFQGDSQVNVALAGETFVIHLLPPGCNFAQRGYPGATLLALAHNADIHFLIVQHVSGVECSLVPVERKHTAGRLNMFDQA